MSLFTAQYSEEDGLPATLCAKCVVHVSKAFAFIRLCHKSDENLRQLQRSKLAVSPVPREEAEKTEDADAEDVSDDPPSRRQSVDANLLEVKCKAESVDNDGYDYQQVDVLYETEVLDEMEEEDALHEEDEELLEQQEGSESHEEEILGDTQQLEPIHIGPKRPQQSRGRHAKSAIERPAEGPPYPCPECGKLLSNFNSYKYHMQLHSDKTPFLCNECGEGFKTRNAYDGHMISHAEVNPHTCNMCGKSYRQAASLRSHMLSHSGVKPFSCEICGKGMTQKSGYKVCKYFMVKYR